MYLGVGDGESNVITCADYVNETVIRGIEVLLRYAGSQSEVKIIMRKHLKRHWFF